MVERGDWLEALLEEEGRSFAPPAPDMRAGVAAAIATPRARSSTLRRAALVAAAAAAIALIATLAIPPARTGVAEFFGLIEGYHVEIVEAPPTPVPRATRLPAATAESTPAATATPTATATPEASASPTPIETVAVPATAAEAEAFLGVPLVLLEGRETPEIFLMSHVGGDWVILRYGDLDLWQTQGITYFGKAGAPGTVIETPLVNGRGAYWVEGPREIRFSPEEDADGLEVERNSLIWQGATLVYRVETDLPLEEVLVIAASLP